MSRRAWSVGGGVALTTVLALFGVLVLFIAVATGTGNAALQAAARSRTAPVGTGGGTLKPGSVPAAYEPWVLRAAAACPGLPAPVLASQLQQESGFNPAARSNAGAEGIAQFMPGTWNTWKTDANGDGAANVWDPADAITAQGTFMCSLLKQATASGYPGQPIELALAGYNAGWGAVQRYRGVPPKEFASGQTNQYVRTIMAGAAKYTAATGAQQLPTEYALPANAPAKIRIALAWALQQRGGWYHLGGDCTHGLGSDPAHQCDCSSLVQQAYHAAGVNLPRTTFDQVNAGIAVSPDAPLPGDLVFSAGSDGTTSSPGHVGLYVGGGQLLESPRTGLQTRLVSYASWRQSTSNITRVVAVRRVVTW
ncbi:C40 family peptidase [Streptomyces sp. H39-S7]|uniref:C40 family peptidase n=1 Tax=Streptomyces sp. H39-S7 TaxID=3004357 RepID=UPI0022AFC50F|nr:bifunctional lytic transglycosylase/C40 family peptidase [Streptomyces sp. H39-S7]MCZ4125438.1 bifunctional lytic transglycosylase/C40 family peptidase [Streptomyces sp. H39-S7]